jgi:hypothetical protein
MRFRGVFFDTVRWFRHCYPLKERVRFLKNSQFCVEFLIIWALAVVVFPVSESRLREWLQLIL